MKYVGIVITVFITMILMNSVLAERAIPSKDIDNLFKQLKYASDYDTARKIEQNLWDAWKVDSTNVRAKELMWLGIISMEQNELDSAVLMFNGVIENDPDWAEGWNKRATVNFFLGEYEASARDIEETLIREPRHFGALNGMAHIFTGLNDDVNAMLFFKRALWYHPYMKDARVVLQALEKRNNINDGNQIQNK